MHEGIDFRLVALLACALALWGMVSKRLARWNITGPIVFTLIGIGAASSAWAAGGLEPTSGTVRTVAELTLAVVLFGDAATVRFSALRRDSGLPARLLLVGLPLTMVLGTLGARLLFPGLSWWLCAFIGCAVAPTDAALGAAIVDDERVPKRIRRALNVESGLNDGIATPFVTFFLVASVAGTALQEGSRGKALAELGLGVLVGSVIGLAGGRGLSAALRRTLADPAAAPVVVAALSIGAYAAALAVGANGFVAAFVAGIAFRSGTDHEQLTLPDEEQAERGALGFVHAFGQILSLLVWFLFGVLVASPLTQIDWRDVVFALLALTVFRMAPVALALLGAGFDRVTVAVIGWFGPRGLASVVFGLLAVDTLEAGTGSRTETAIGVTVVLSVLLHGVSASPITSRFAATHSSAETGEHDADAATA